MSTILITGGTGHLGREIVQLIKAGGSHDIRILARRPGDDSDVEWIKGDLGTGSGVPEAVRGVDAIVHAATNSPAARRGRLRLGDLVGSPQDVDEVGTRRLLAEAQQSRVKHFLHISIVGVQQSRLPYSRVKAAAENVVRDGNVPWSIVPATGLDWLLARMLDRLANRRVWLLPSNLHMQPCDAADFADHVVECLEDGPRGLRLDFGGPQILTLPELAREYQAAHDIRRRIAGLPLPRFAVRAAGRQVCADGRHGTTTWAKWIRSDATTKRKAGG